MQLEVSPLAEQDLQEILKYIARDKPDAAVQWIERIRREFALITRHPQVFPWERQTRLGFRKAVVGRYLILFRTQGDRVRIERVIHGMRDLRSLSADQSE